MDCDLVMYLRAARSMAAFVGWCDGGSTDDGCAAASMDETTIKSLHTLHQHNYDTGKALQAFVKIINPKSVDKRWSDEDAKKFVRGLKQHGKNFFKIRKELLPYKDTASLVEYYYLWKKTPAASTTRPHRRHRRPAFRRQAPTPTLPQGDDMDDVSSASEASEMESEEECQQTTGVSGNNHHHEATLSCSRCSVTKSSRWYESGKDSMVCADCHHGDEMLTNQNDEEAPPNCDPVCAPEDEGARAAMDEDAPPFMFRPVKEDEKMSTEDMSLIQNGNKSTASSLNTEAAGPNNEDATTPAASPVDSKENVASILSAKEEVTVKDESEELKKGIQSLLMTNTEEDQNVMPKKLEQTIKTEEKMKVESMIEEPPESSKWYGFPSSFTPTTSFSSQQSAAPPPLSSSIAPPPSIFDVKPPRAVASVAPTFQDASSLSQQSVPSFQIQNSPVAASSNHQQSSFRPPSPHDLCSVRRHPSLPSTTSSYPVSTHSALYAPQTSSHLPPSPTPFLPASTSGFLPHLAAPSSYHQPIPLAPSAFSSTSAMPEDMSIRKREMSTNNMERPVSNSSSYKSTPASTSSSQQHHQQQQQQQPSICHISDDDDDEDDCNVARSPSPEPLPANEQVYDTPTAIFIKRWNRGQNTCSRCDFEFIPSKNNTWANRREEKMMQKNAPSNHHHHHHQPHHNKNASHHSVLKDGRRDSRKEEDKNKSPMTNRSSDAQITSSLIGGSHHLPPFAGPSDRMPSRPGLFHDPTPALSQLSAYARPHIGNQRCLNYSLPPPHSMEPYFRMPGMYPPGSRDVLDMDIDKHLWERDLRDRDFREMEFMEKMKQEMELKSAAVAGFERLSHIPGDPVWADVQRRFMSSQLALSAAAPPPPGHLPGIFPPAGNLSAELMQRERLEQLARIGSSQEQMAAAARDGALLQIYQRYAQDPVMLQRQIQAYMANKAQESVHLVYHFAKADPLASAVTQASGMGGTSAGGIPSGHIPPPPTALHSIPQNHPFLAFARDQERIYMELLSRPPYSTDPILAQQMLSSLTAQAAAQQEALQRQLALERDYPGNPMLH